MFLGYLSDEEKASFLSIASRLCAVDGMDPRETAQMRVFEREAGQTASDNGSSLEELCQAFGTRRARMSATIELIAISMADEKQSSQEIEMLDQITEHFALEQDDIDAALEWVLAQRELIADAHELLEEA